MQETVSMLGLTIISLLVFSTLFGFYALESFVQSQEMQAAQTVVLGSAENGGVTASGNNTLVYTPLTPGLEANGGRYSYLESVPYQYTYSYPVASTETYFYYTPQNSFTMIRYAVPKAESAAYTYSVYSSQAAPAQYSVPYSEQTQYVYTSYEQTSNSEDAITFLACPSLVSHTGCWFAHYIRILAGFVTYTVSYSYTTYSQGSKGSAYPVPYTTMSTGAYTILQDAQSVAQYTAPVSIQYSCPYTLYGQGSYAYAYYTPVNSEQAGVYYLNQTKIEDGQYQVVEVPQSYTYWNTSWRENTAVYYYGIPVSAQANCYRLGTNSLSYIRYTPYQTTHTYTFEQSRWKQEPYTEYYGRPSTVSGSYQVSYPVFALLYGWYSYSYVVHPFVVRQALPVRHYGSFLQTRWRSSVSVWYTPKPNTYSGDYQYTSYDLNSVNLKETLGKTQHSGLYTSSRLVRASALAYMDYIVSPAYSYYQATFTNQGSFPVNITAIVYQNGTSVYILPVGNHGWDVGFWLASEKWYPGNAWSGWGTWGEGTSLGDGYTGYDTGVPFITDGIFNGRCVVLESGQSVTVPFVNGFAVGFISTSGNVWWIA